MNRPWMSGAAFLFVILGLLIGAARGQQAVTPTSTQPATVGNATAASRSESLQTPKVTAYTLPPDLSKKAHDRAQIHFRLALLGFVYGLIVLWLILRLKIGAKYRDWAEGIFSNRFLQAAVFAPLLVLTIAIFTLPLDIYGEMVEKEFGISVQSWSSWGADWVKNEVISLILATILIYALYAVIRRSARRWWFYFWLVALPLGILMFFLTPWVIDPLFHKFEPLQQKDPALTAALQKMVQRAGEDIPPQRMFWMGAGEKTTALNAYVTGIGASKRMVVWDTTIARMNTPQIVFVAGHETGHYVLQHIPKGLCFFAVLLLVVFYLGYRTIGWTLARWGRGWGIRGLDDWASLPVLMLLMSVFLFVTGPIGSAFSRHIEHQADQFGLEVTHGLTPDSGQIAAQAFQIIGEVDLADPNPNPLAVFLYSDHPTIPDRVQYSLTYEPWSQGGQGEFIK